MLTAFRKPHLGTRVELLVPPACVEFGSGMLWDALLPVTDVDPSGVHEQSRSYDEATTDAVKKEFFQDIQSREHKLWPAGGVTGVELQELSSCKRGQSVIGAMSQKSFAV
ncbi:hypothetical protein JOB18_037776 [Solea senegalensis]|uniref:Uncharacterized protein n=1 Tax=Solea senegalensis TaxID=28829 RepID=A0AAV6QP34_SOLSE|nr:hypothetical protein JOB18_037776 [Solea senegalensis]